MERRHGKQKVVEVEDDDVGINTDDDIQEIDDCNAGKESEKNHDGLEINKQDLLELLKVGSEFTTKEEIYDCFKKFGALMGFLIRKRSSKKDHDGILRYITLTCAREGKKSSNSANVLRPRPLSQTDCKVCLRAALGVNEKWRITSSFLDHNHVLSPTQSRFYKCNRNVTPSVRRRLELNERAGIRMYKSYGTIVEDAHDYENVTVTERDCRNYVDQLKRLALVEGDVVAIQRYFLNMQTQNKDFFYCMDHDEQGHLKNLFWADGRSRKCYKEFGDVITFDTTYLANRYDMPFAPFVGVNHHGHTVLLGCGLIANENIESFVWLFETWLTCMNNSHPMGIITDQDAAMKVAIAKVFPNTRHRLCLWHILKKLPQKLGGDKNYKNINYKLHDLVYDSQYKDEFERGWLDMIHQYGLEQHKWLLELYEDRHRWVPVYLKTSFWAGMSSTQRSESVNAFFDGYVHPKTSLKQFVEQYGRAAREKAEKEAQADFGSYSQMIPCVTRYRIEFEAQVVYTNNIFRAFQKELISLLYLYPLGVRQMHMYTGHDVQEDIHIGENGLKRMVYTVSFSQAN